MSKKVIAKKEQEDKKDNKKLLILILLLLFLCLSLGLYTYAWFSSNKNALIDTIDINVQTVTGLQVSEDAINWDNDITREELINAYKTYPRAENQLPDTLAGVSSALGVTNGKLDIFYGLISEEGYNKYSIQAVPQEEINCVGDEDCVDKHYVAFDIFLLTTTPADIGITAESFVRPQEGAQDKGSQNAARVGFVVEGSVGPTASLAAQNLKSNNKALLWEPNYDRHTEFGVQAAKNVYGITTTTSGAARIPYKGINQPFSEHVLLTETRNSPYFTTVNPTVATTETFSNNQALMRIPAGITKVRIYLWLEGEDVDMENNAAASQLSFNIELTMTN